MFHLPENTAMHSNRILPRTIQNPTENYRVTFLQSGAEHPLGYCHVEVLLPPGAGTPVHYHLTFEEEFTAIKGVLGIQVDGQVVLVSPGDRAAVAPLRSHHRFFNPGQEPVIFRAWIKPARRFEDLLRTTYGLAADGLANKKGIPKNILTLALVYEMGESYLPGLPLKMQKNIFGLLARIARWRKKDKALEKYYVGTIAPVTNPAE